MAKLNISRGTLFWVLASSFNSVEEYPTGFGNWSKAYVELAPGLSEYDLEGLQGNMIPRLEKIIPRLKKDGDAAIWAPVAEDILDTLKRTA